MTLKREVKTPPVIRHAPRDRDLRREEAAWAAIVFFALAVIGGLVAAYGGCA